MPQAFIGTVRCDFVSLDDFYRLCKTWLASHTFHHIVTLNAEMVVEARQNKAFQRAVEAAAIRVPEGGPLWAQSYLAGKSYLLPSLLTFMKRESQRITGVDTLPTIAGLAYKAGLSTYLLGGKPQEAARAAQRLQEMYPGITVHVGPHHEYMSYGPSFVLRDIQVKAPGLLFVAYGAPKQTLWIESHREELPSVRIAVGVGGAFAMVGDNIPRAPKSLRQHNLEWVWRLWKEPSRLPRIWRATVQFPLLIQQQKRLTRSSSPK